MQTRRVGSFEVSAIGLGCMSLSHAYGVPPDTAYGGRLLNRALDLGYTFLDTAALYGFGANETLLGAAIAHRRREYVLASKCGIGRNAEGKREINGRPESIKATCEESLARLKTDVIDLYYLHRWDRRVPIEESVGALADLVAAGKIRAIGLSEVSAQTLRKAHAVHPVAAVQSEYSLWTRNPEVAVLDACRDLGVTFVAFGPLARGFLAGPLPVAGELPAGDIRKAMPRFQGEDFARNRKLLSKFARLATELGCKPAHLALAWVLAQGDDIVPIPGTARIEHLEENLGGELVELDEATLVRLDEVINARTVSGARYNPGSQADIDTEELAS
jgi:aryl-alcohol dehydrogenase-like predicted oxidoreductase